VDPDLWEELLSHHGTWIRNTNPKSRRLQWGHRAQKGTQCQQWPQVVGRLGQTHHTPLTYIHVNAANVKITIIIIIIMVIK
jgi:hypothetical protein